MTPFEQFWPIAQPIAAQVAAEFGRRHHIHGAEANDFLQEFAIWLIENEEVVAEWLEELEPRHFERHLATCLRNEAKDYGIDMKAQAVGYKREDLYFYSKNEVKALLPSVFDPDKWHEPPQSEGRSSKSAAEGGNWLATLADVSQAVAKLTPYDRDLLLGFHKDGWNNKMMAEAEDLTEATMSYRHGRAIDRLVALLGDSAPYPMRKQVTKRDIWRGRRAISTPQARAMTGADYE